MTPRTTVRLAATGLALLTVLPGCETTAQKSARLEAREGATANEQGLKVTRRNPDVRVSESSVVSDANGTAVIVTLRDTGDAGMADVPIAIDVRNAKRKSLFRNDEPGLEPALTSASALAPGEDLSWVHDQVLIDEGKPASVRVRVGAAKRPAPGQLPKLTLSSLALTHDPTSGTEGVGRVTNRSNIEQRQLTIFAVARRGARVVAAGRAVVRKLAPGKAARFSVFFIGNPAGARISVAAPPTVLG